MPDKETFELLRELLNRRPDTGVPGWSAYPDPLNAAPAGLPQVPPPPMFRNATEVIGGPKLQQSVESLLRVAPELRGKINRVQAAPTSSSMRRAMRSDIDVSDLPFSNLLGQWDPDNKSIYINPRITGDVQYGGFYEDPLESIIAHEFGHAAGYGHGSKIDKLEVLGRKMAPEPVYPNDNAIIVKQMLAPKRKK